MSCEVDEMLHDSDDSESDFEVISLNPNINYESDDSSMDEEETNQNVIKNPSPSQEEEEKHQEVKIIEEITEVKMEEDIVIAPIDDENSMNSIDFNYPTKVRKKLNLEEYKMRRANEKPQKPLFDVPRRIAAYELCDVTASLPLLILPTDPNGIHMLTDDSRGLKKQSQSVSNIFNPDHYEEIIIVSTGCNTEVTIPPVDERDDESEKKPASKFLTNIVNNLNKDSVELLNSSTSLFSSIQAVVQGKCVSTGTDDIEQSCEKSSESKEHGEDKIIMHLRKDRLRPFKCSIAIQTDTISLFPPLLLSPSLIFNRIRNARNYRRKISRSRSRSRSRSFSPDMDYDRVKYNNNNSRYSRSQHSTHSSSMNSSSSESDSDSSDCSSSSDSLKRFNDRQNFRFYNRNQSNQGYKYPEERKIIYIGGLEEETTKDEIRRKFLNYGTIKKISFHSKEDGLRYGFVTFAEAECAYEVIDKFSKDPLISKYDIRFGGRRKFCKQSYADLDSIQDKEYAEAQKSTKDLSFEDLLKLAKNKIVAKK